MSVSEYEHEPVRGLPGYLPEGETLVWQGAPDRAVMSRRVFHVRTVGIYLAVLITVHMAILLSKGATLPEVMLTSSWMLGLGLTAIAILAAMAWAYARATVYTITDKRIVLRCGVAMPMMVNIPLSTIVSADMRRFGDGSGDIILSVDKRKRLSYLLLWPNVKSWQFSPVMPALRSLPAVETVAAVLAEAAQVERVGATAPSAATEPVHVGDLLGAS